jgi:phosphoesterase RecJ-like protein
MLHTSVDPPEALIAICAEEGPVCVTAHDRPDGDAIGAALGAMRILREAGRPACVVGCHPVPQRYRFLLDGDVIQDADPRAHPDAALLVLDTAKADRAEAVARWREAGRSVYAIDHHRTHDPFADPAWVDPDASSSAELVVRLAMAAGRSIRPPAADALWAGILTDTGCFTYENTVSSAMHAAATLIEAGARPAYVAASIYRNHTWAEVQLRGRALQSLQSAFGGSVAWVTLAHDDFELAHAAPEDAEGIVNIPRDLEGVDLALFFYEPPDRKETKVSLRASERIDGTVLAGRFGGGGHARAAGFSVDEPVSSARERVLAAVDELYGEFLGDAGRRQAAGTESPGSSSQEGEVG